MILFEEISASESGIFARGQSYGGAWADVNGDGNPDLWINSHLNPGILYLNQGDGTFRDATAEIFSAPPGGDPHGTAFIDIDNDGDQDLFQATGANRGLGSDPSQLYINEGGILDDRASALEIDYPLARGRGILPFDFDNDGLLDLVVGATPREDGQAAPPKIFRQNADGTFSDASATAGFNLSEAIGFFLSDISGDGDLDFVARAGSSNFTAYDTTSLPFANITSELPNSVRGGALATVASADFNGDLQPDYYVTRATGLFGDEVLQTGGSSAVASLAVTRSEEGFSVDTTGEITFDISTTDGRFSVPLSEVYIGANGINPTDFEFTLSPDSPEVVGILPHTPGSDRGIYIGYDPAQQRWQLLLSTSDQNLPAQNIQVTNTLIASIETSEPISDLGTIGFQNSLPPNDQILLSTPQGLVDRSNAVGINSILTQSRSAVTGDFDNDMDEDIYVVTSRRVANTPNVLYENQGDGTFVAVPLAGGAAGASIGRGDFVITSDYDSDGFLDLLVANGDGPRTPLTDNAPYQLFRNQGNENHWFQIDLEGVQSNRDGIGAQVFLTAGGVTQLREQSGGINEDSQNHQRLHFGLGQNTIVDELIIRWPSGTEQRLNNLSVDRIVRIREEPGGSIPHAPTPTGDVLYRVNTGGPTIAATDGGPDWLADTADNNSAFLFDPGSNNTFSFPAVEPGPSVPSSVPGTIFDTERFDQVGGSNLQYAFDVPATGNYEVRLYLANGFLGTSAPGQRVFDVALEGSVPSNLNDIDLSAQFGSRIGGVISNVVTVDDGTLNVEFLHEVQNPLVNGIEITQLDGSIAPAPSPSDDTVLFRVNAGGPQIAATDDGPNWSADTLENNSDFLLNPGSNRTTAYRPGTIAPGPTVDSSAPSAIFDSQRFDAAGGSEMQYAFDVPTAGDYEVRLYLANGFSNSSAPGQRVFDVALEGTVPSSLDNIDLSAQFGHQVGGVISNEVTVSDGTLNIEFLHGIRNPLVNGIEIVQLG